MTKWDLPKEHKANLTTKNQLLQHTILTAKKGQPPCDHLQQSQKRHLKNSTPLQDKKAQQGRHRRNCPHPDQDHPPTPRARISSLLRGWTQDRTPARTISGQHCAEALLARGQARGMRGIQVRKEGQDC